MAVVAQKDKELGTPDTFDNGVFGGREVDSWLPKGWAHDACSFR